MICTENSYHKIPLQSMLDCLLGGSFLFERRSPFHYVGLCHFTAAQSGPPFSSRPGSGHHRSTTHLVLWPLCASALPSIGHRVNNESVIVEMNLSSIFASAIHAVDPHTLAFSLLWPVKKWKPIFHPASRRI